MATVLLSGLSAVGVRNADGAEGLLGSTLGLLAKSTQGVSDPYLWLSLGGMERQTSTLHDTLEPVWEESYRIELPLRLLLAEPLRLEIFDEDLFSSDDTLGTAEISASEIERLVHQASSGKAAAPPASGRPNKGASQQPAVDSRGSRSFELPLAGSKAKGSVRIHACMYTCMHASADPLSSLWPVARPRARCASACPSSECTPQARLKVHLKCRYVRTRSYIHTYVRTYVRAGAHPRVHRASALPEPERDVDGGSRAARRDGS